MHYSKTWLIEIQGTKKKVFGIIKPSIIQNSFKTLAKNVLKKLVLLLSVRYAVT
jgi:hypothetical protein